MAPPMTASQCLTVSAVLLSLSTATAADSLPSRRALLRVRGGQWNPGGEYPPPPQHHQPPPQQAYGSQQPPPPGTTGGWGTPAAPASYGQPQQQQQPGGPYGQPPQPQSPYGQQPPPQSQSPYGQQQQQPPPPQAGGYQRPGGPAQYGGGPLPTFGSPPPGSSGAGGAGPTQPFQPPVVAELVRVGVRGQEAIDTAALPRLNVAQAALLRQPAESDGAALQTTFTAVAESATLQKQLKLPLGALVQPLVTECPARVIPEHEHSSTLCRCRSCSAYLNAYARIDERSLRWECNLCGELNELPPPPQMQQQQQGYQQGGGQQQHPGGGGFFKGLWGAGGAGGAQGAAASAAAPEPRADLRHAEVEYILSVAEARQYSPPELADAVVAPPTVAAGNALSSLPPRAAVLVIAIDTSPRAYASGAVRAYCEAVAAALKAAASEAAASSSSLRVALMTYDRNVQAFYFRRSAEGRPAGPPLCHVVPAGDGGALPTMPQHMPTPLVELADALPDIETLLSTLPDAQPEVAQFDDDNDGAALPAAVHVALELLDGTVSKLILCSASGASAGAGKTTRVLPTPAAPDESPAEKEEALDSLERLMRPEGVRLADLAKRCFANGLTVDLAIAPSAAFVDVASLAPLCKLTGGDLTHVPEFLKAGTAVGSATDRITAAVRKSVCDRAAGSEGVFRVRASPGLAATRIVGAAGEADVNVVNVPTLQEGTTFAVELSHESGSGSGSSSAPASLKGDRAFIQSALLYTAADGTRRIRVLTRPLRVVHEPAALVRAAHPPALAALLAKFACDDVSRTSTKQVAESVQAACANAVAAMRELCPPPLRRIAEEMILTRPLELLPLLTLATLKLPPLARPAGGSGAYSPDAAAASAHRALWLPAHLMCLLLVPRVQLIHLRNEGDGWIPADASAATPPAAGEGTTASADGSDASGGGAGATAHPPSPPAPPAARELAMLRGSDVSPAGVYLLDGLDEQVLWVGQHAAPPFLNAIFGTERPADGAPLQSASASDEAAKLHALVDAANAGRPFDTPLRVVVQGSPEQPRFFARLAADGYEQFAMGLHARVQPKL